METTTKYNAQPIYTENNVPVYPNQVRQYDNFTLGALFQNNLGRWWGGGARAPSALGIATPMGCSLRGAGDKQRVERFVCDESSTFL